MTYGQEQKDANTERARVGSRDGCDVDRPGSVRANRPGGHEEEDSGPALKIHQQTARSFVIVSYHLEEERPALHE